MLFFIYMMVEIGGIRNLGNFNLKTKLSIANMPVKVNLGLIFNL